MSRQTKLLLYLRAVLQFPIVHVNQQIIIER